MKAFAEMMSSRVKVLALAMATSLLGSLSNGQDSNAQLLADAKTTFGLIYAPTQEELDKPIVELGRHLFWDERLSANGKIACASCHAASSWGADAERKGKRVGSRFFCSCPHRTSRTVVNDSRPFFHGFSLAFGLVRLATILPAREGNTVIRLDAWYPIGSVAGDILSGVAVLAETGIAALRSTRDDEAVAEVGLIDDG